MIDSILHDLETLKQENISRSDVGAILEDIQYRFEMVSELLEVLDEELSKPTVHPDVLEALERPHAIIYSLSAYAEALISEIGTLVDCAYSPITDNTP